MTKVFVTAFATAIGTTTIIILAVFLTESTFGQRCAVLYPGDTLMTQEACIKQLSKACQ